MKDNIKVLKKGNYIKVYKNNDVMASYSSITKKMYGATKYFKYLDNYISKSINNIRTKKIVIFSYAIDIEEAKDDNDTIERAKKVWDVITPRTDEMNIEVEDGGDNQ